MNIRNTLAVLALGLASSMAMAATTPATPATPATKATPATPAKPATHKAKALAHKLKDCKHGETLVKGKCETGKAHS